MDTENITNEESLMQENPVATTPTKLEITEDISKNLSSAGKWTFFLSIIGFIGIGFMIISGIGVSIVMAFLPTSGPTVFPFPMFLIGLIYIIFAVVYFFPILYLFRFSNSIKQAVALKHQELLNKAFTNLKAHYKTFGIILIVILCLYPIMIICMLLFGFFTGLDSTSGLPV